jgi:hypothetical protein
MRSKWPTSSDEHDVNDEKHSTFVASASAQVTQRSVNCCGRLQCRGQLLQRQLT